MPKDLFFNLNDEKRMKIIEVALEEFSNNLFQEASINQIIKKAQISRGSFYQYFEDKEDLYLYLLETIINSTAIPFIKTNLISNNQSLHQFYRSLFIYNLEMVSNKKYQLFFKNLYLSINYQLDQKIKVIFNNIKNDFIQSFTQNQINNLGLNTKTFNELLNIIELNNRDLIMKKLIDNISDDQVLEIYDLRLQIITNNLKEKTNEINI